MFTYLNQDVAIASPNFMSKEKRKGKGHGYIQI